MGGSSTIGGNGGRPGVYGVLGAGSAANIPGGRAVATSWVDKSGNLWLYGGDGYDGQGNYGQMDDLWEFSPSKPSGMGHPDLWWREDSLGG